MKKTARGFDLFEFRDHYENRCSLQKSSLVEPDAVWLGVEDANPMQLIPGQGWRPVPFPEGTSFSTRMHLTQAQVAELLPLLQRFVETGDLT